LWCDVTTRRRIPRQSIGAAKVRSFGRMLRAQGQTGRRGWQISGFGQAVTPGWLSRKPNSCKTTERTHCTSGPRLGCLPWQVQSRGDRAVGCTIDQFIRSQNPVSPSSRPVSFLLHFTIVSETLEIATAKAAERASAGSSSGGIPRTGRSTAAIPARLTDCEAFLLPSGRKAPLSKAYAGERASRLRQQMNSWPLDWNSGIRGLCA
jgi:hypothetical protein